MNFFHRLFNPHCEHCAEERRESKICSSCETLTMINEKLQYTNDQLMKRLLDSPKVNEVRPPVNDTEGIPNQTQHIPWRVRQQLLEKEDREKARILKEAAKPIDKLEKEVLS